jgi:hypothetical protein
VLIFFFFQGDMKMKKLLILVGGLCCVFAAHADESNFNSAESNAEKCREVRKQVKDNRKAIEEFYKVNNECALGKLAIANYNLYKENKKCFHRRKPDGSF